MRYLIIAVLVLVGIIHVLPLAGVLANWAALALLLMGFGAYALSLRQKGTGHGNPDQY